MPGGWCAGSRERLSLVELRAQEVGVRETTGREAVVVVGVMGAGGCTINP